MVPFLKWAGGKRWLTSCAEELLPEPNSFNNYIEPFLGGGAVFFHLIPERGILSDINKDLITTYTVIRDNWEPLQELLSQYHYLHTERFYYEMRRNEPIEPVYKAARFIYLNRTCWNGLYRVNLNGEFNVPIGTKTKVIMETDDFEWLSDLLRGFQLIPSDFERMIDLAQENDFVFVDPPYTVKHNLNGFIKYNEKLFAWADQVRLRDSVVRAIARGAKVLVLNADHTSIRELYEGIGTVVSLDRASVIAGSASARGIYNELAVKCW